MSANRNITVLTEQIDGDEFKLLMLSVDGHAIGCCQIASWNEDQPSIMGLIIDPQHRRRGHAAALIQAAIEAAKTDGKFALSLTVEKENTTAVALYCRMGFATDFEDPAQLWMSIQLNPQT